MRIAARLFVALAAGAGAAGAGVGLMATAAWLISRAATHPPVLHLMVAIVAVRAFGIGRGVLRYVERLVGHDAALRVLAALRVRVYRRLERLAPAGLAAFRRGDLVERMVSDVDAVLDVLVRVLLPLAVAATVAVGSVVLVGAILPAAGLALAAGLLVVCVGAPALQAALGRRAAARLAPLRGELAAGTVDLLHGLPDLVAYGATGRALDRLTRTDRRLRQAARRGATTAGLSAALTTLATGASVLVGLVAGAVAVRAGSLPGELLAVVVLTPLATFEAVAAVPAAAQRLAEARGALGRVRAVLRAPDPTPDPAVPEPIGPGPHTIALESVTAGWAPTPADPPGADQGRHTHDGRSTRAGIDQSAGGSTDVGESRREVRIAVREVSLTLAPGRRVALVGPSGAGKSTVAALLVRWLDPVAGRVTLDGVDVRRLRGDDLRRVVGYCGEDAYLFDTTIEANLRIARPGATAAELDAALRAARLLDWVRSLPDGRATAVGEHGLALSGGQRRRLALARALLAGFPILVLDEPTEHLDDATAAELIRDLRAIGDRTILVITHRRAGLDEFDEVVELLPGGVLRGAGRAVGAGPLDVELVPRAEAHEVAPDHVLQHR